MSEGEGLVQQIGHRTWLDAFPWLQADTYTATSNRSGEDWRYQPVISFTPTERREILFRLTATAMDRMQWWTLGELFPTLSPDLRLSTLPFTTRAMNAMRRERLTTFGDLQDMTTQRLLAMHNVGITSVYSMLNVMAERALASVPPSLAVGDSAAAVSWDYANSADRPSPAIVGLINEASEDLLQIAHWLAATGNTDAPLLAPLDAPGVPPAIVDVRRRLTQLTAQSVLGLPAASVDAADIVDASIVGLDDRELDLLRYRLFADHPQTLEQVGSNLGITRERVRQIESGVRGKVTQLLIESDVLELVAQSVRLLIETVLPLDDLLAKLPALQRTVQSVGQPVWRILDRLDDAYEIVDGWCTAPSLMSARAATLTRLHELANAYGVVSLEDFGPLNANLTPERDQPAKRNWLEECGYLLHSDFVLTQVQSLGDRAAALLSIAGAPLPAEEILDQIAPERSLGSLKNAMSIDERIQRVDRDRWALAEWGLEAYTGVRALVGEELDRNSGRMSMDQLVEHITSRYSVRPNSVVAYASTSPFESVGGVVRRRSIPQAHRKTPGETRRLYRRGDEWLYRVQITHEHLRGSGTVAPVAIADILGLAFGDTCLLDSPVDVQSVTWTSLQPSFGSIRRLLIINDIAAGTEAFLVISDDRRFRIEVVATAVGDPELDALALVGAADPADGDEARSSLALAVGLPESVSVSDLVASYRSRGDTDVADLIVACRDQLSESHQLDHVAAPEIEEILDLL